MASDALDLFIGPTGEITAVYDDLLAEMFPDEALLTQRASNVEPHPTRQGWCADMIQSRGPVLGDAGTTIAQWEFAAAGSAERSDALWDRLVPFPTRQAALDAERAWLDNRMREGAL